MEIEHAVLPVDRHEILRLDQSQHEFLLFLGTMARSMDVCQFAVDYISAGFIQSVDRTVDAQSIPRNRGGTEDDSIVRDDADLAVSAVCDPWQGCHRLTLRSGAEYHDFVLFNLIDHLRFDECFRRCFDIAELRTDADAV